VVEAVRRIVALQAQENASPYLALWNRLADFDPADLDTAFANGAVVKATLIRITLHAVHAQDWPVFHNAMMPLLRASRLHDLRFKSSGLSIADADALLPHLTRFAARPRTGAEIEDMLATEPSTAATPTGGPRRCPAPKSVYSSPDPANGRRRCGSTSGDGLGQPPHLVAAAKAVPDLQPGAVGGAHVLGVEALA